MINSMVRKRIMANSLEEELKKTDYEGIQYATTIDLAELIAEDYDQLAI